MVALRQHLDAVGAQPLRPLVLALVVMRPPAFLPQPRGRLATAFGGRIVDRRQRLFEDRREGHEEPLVKVVASSIRLGDVSHAAVELDLVAVDLVDRERRRGV